MSESIEIGQPKKSILRANSETLSFLMLDFGEDDRLNGFGATYRKNIEPVSRESRRLWFETHRFLDRPGKIRRIGISEAISRPTFTEIERAIRARRALATARIRFVDEEKK